MAKHVNWFKEDKEKYLKTLTNEKVYIIDYEYLIDNQEEISNWAKHLRNHYCKDSEIDFLRNGTGLSRQEYLEQIKFPEKGHIISGDFSEILVADFLEYLRLFKIPRTRYLDKINKDTSPNGTDIIGFKIINGSGKDELVTCEVKARIASAKEDIVQEAVTHARKDVIRIAESLNAMKQKLYMSGDNENVKLVERFQNKVDRPYKRITTAAIVHSNDNWNNELVTAKELDTKNIENLEIIVIKGAKMMDLARLLYRRACDEA